MLPAPHRFISSHRIASGVALPSPLLSSILSSPSHLHHISALLIVAQRAHNPFGASASASAASHIPVPISISISISLLTSTSTSTSSHTRTRRALERCAACALDAALINSSAALLLASPSPLFSQLSRVAQSARLPKNFESPLLRRPPALPVAHSSHSSSRVEVQVHYHTVRS